MQHLSVTLLALGLRSQRISRQCIAVPRAFIGRRIKFVRDLSSSVVRFRNRFVFYIE